MKQYTQDELLRELEDITNKIEISAISKEDGVRLICLLITNHLMLEAGKEKTWTH